MDDTNAKVNFAYFLTSIFERFFGFLQTASVVCVLVSGVVDHGFERLYGQAKDLKLVFAASHQSTQL